MQTSSSNSVAAQPDAILEWLQKEMGYRPLGPYSSSSSQSSPSTVPSIDSIRRVCRGNMIPIWNFLLNRVKSEKTVERVRRNIHVHGNGARDSDSVNEEVKSNKVGRKKEKDKSMTGIGENSGGAESSREVAMREREMAAKEVERLRNVVKRQRKDLRARMLEVSREEAERKRMLDERSNYRFQFIYRDSDCLCLRHCVWK